nr:protein kinase [Endozoicomonas ascidiicola]
MDFGAAVEGKTQRHFRTYERAPLYLPPELVTNPYSRPSITDMEKADVYSLGVFIGETFSSGELFTHGCDELWTARSLHQAQYMITDRLTRLNIRHPEIASLVRDMVNAKPQSRPSMQAVNQRLQRIMAQESLPREARSAFKREDSGYGSATSTPLSEKKSENTSPVSSHTSTRNNTLNAIFKALDGKEIKTFDHAMTALGLDYKTASIDAAKKAYRKQALRYHPDKFQPNNLDGLSGQLEKLEVQRQKQQAADLMCLLKKAQERIITDLNL